MTAETETSPEHTDRGALAFLLQQVGVSPIIILFLLMILASASEGLGLMLLVPIIQLVSDPAGPGVMPAALAPIASMSLPVLLAGMIALVAIRSLIIFLVNERRRALGLNLASSLRRDIHGSIVGARWRWLSAQNSGDHAALIMGESARVAALANQGIITASAVVTMLVLTLSASAISLKLTLVVAAGGLVAASLASPIFRRSDRLGNRFADAYRDMQRQLSNGLRHLRAARIAGAESDLADAFARTDANLVGLERRYARTSHVFVAIVPVLASVALAVLVWLAMSVWQMDAAILIPVIAIFARIAPLGSTVMEGGRGWRFNRPALDRIKALIAAADHAREGEETAAPAICFEREIALRKVTIHYDGAPKAVLSRFNLAITKGEIIGISGPSGSGKSSLGDVLSGLITPDDGEFAVDGQVLGRSRARSWRDQVGYVEQSPFFLDASISENLKWGFAADAGVPDPNPTRTQIDRALTLASAQFVHDLAGGLETPMGEGGYQFSGGERQRIALARALLSNPRLLILDEVTSGLDAANTAMIRESIAALRGTCTVVIFSHDHSLLAIADRRVELGRRSQGE